MVESEQAGSGRLRRYEGKGPVDLRQHVLGCCESCYNYCPNEVLKNLQVTAEGCKATANA
jgi:hypothetical protein